MVKSKDFPCFCGHDKKYHFPNSLSLIEGAWCDECFTLRKRVAEGSLDPDGIDLPWWHEYKSDNLLYLEGLDEEDA